MKVIPPDFDRTLDLPGLGPTPCPVDIDQAGAGFADLLSLRIHDFAAGLVFGLHGAIERVTAKVFLLSPSTVEVNAEESAVVPGKTLFNQS